MRQTINVPPQEDHNHMDILNALRNTLKKPENDKDDLQKLMPLIVPSTYFTEHQFPATYALLPNPDFALTAVILGESQAMLYLSEDRGKKWAKIGVNWKDRALQNVRASGSGQAITHSKRTEDGRLLIAFMMQPDGLGTSRVYCSDKISKLCPQGYRIAIPERSVGCVIPNDLTESEEAEATDMVKQLFRIGTVPNSPKIFQPHELGA